MPRKKKSEIEVELKKQTNDALKAEEAAKAKKKRDVELRKFLIPTLRRASYRWKPRTEAKQEARIERGLYECNMCKGHFKTKEIVIDHIDPVVDLIEGWEGWEEYVNRMFCPKEGFQILCKTCHGVKTKMEEEMRKKHRRDKKNAKD